MTYNVAVNPKVSVITDKSQINSENTFVFALVDNIKDQPELKDAAGLAYGEGFGKVAIGEAKYFTYSSAPKNGKNFIFHEIAHLLGAIDIYRDPKKSHATNLMNYLSKNNGTLTSNQIVKEIWGETIGNFVNIWLAVQKNGTYQKTPNDADKQDTRKQLEQFVENNNARINHFLLRPSYL